MRSPHGYAVVTEEGRTKEEFDTVTCFHCNALFRVAPASDPADIGGLCKLCMQLVCGPCADKGQCTPWEKQMEEIEARDRFLRSAGLLEATRMKYLVTYEDDSTIEVYAPDEEAARKHAEDPRVIGPDSPLKVKTVAKQP